MDQYLSSLVGGAVLYSPILLCFLLSKNETFPLALLVFCFFFCYMDVSLRVIHFTHHQNITTCHVGRRGINAGAPWWSSTESATFLTIPLSMPFFHAPRNTVMSCSCEIQSVRTTTVWQSSTTETAQSVASLFAVHFLASYIVTDWNVSVSRVSLSAAPPLTKRGIGTLSWRGRTTAEHFSVRLSFRDS